MIVDVHTHFWDHLEQMGEGTAARLRADGGGPWDRIDPSPEALDDAVRPVDHALVLGFRSHRIGAHVPHASIARQVDRDPRRYIGFAGIDPMTDDFMESLDEAIELGLQGVVVSPAAQGFHPTHTNAMELYDRCEREGLPVLVHPGTHLDTASMLEFAQPHLYDEVGRTFPNLRVILAQVGHPWVDPGLLLIAKHRHFYADLTDLVSRPWQLYNVLLLAHQQGVTQHLLMGSDFPFSTAERTIVTIYSVNTLTHGTNLPSIPREQLRSIVERDALACLGLKPGRHPRQPVEPASADAAASGRDQPADGEAGDGADDPDPDAPQASDAKADPDKTKGKDNDKDKEGRGVARSLRRRRRGKSAVEEGIG